MLLQLSIEIDAIGGYVDFFRAPEEGELFFDQLFEIAVLLLIVARNVDRLPEEHRLFGCVVSAQMESGVTHVFPFECYRYY